MRQDWIDNNTRHFRDNKRILYIGHFYIIYWYYFTQYRLSYIFCIICFINWLLLLLSGITVAGDVFILTIFAIVQAMTYNTCSGDQFNTPLFLINVIMIPAAVVWGYCLGYVLILLLNFKKLKHFILPIGFLTVLCCQYILRVTTSHAKFGIDIDSLLVCITAGTKRPVWRSRLKNKYLYIPCFLFGFISVL